MENNKNELLENIDNRLTAMEAQEKRHSRRLFIAVLVSITLLTALAVFLTVNVSFLMSEMRLFADAAEAIDTEAVAGKINELAAMDTQGLEKLSDYFADMDEDELSARLDSLQDALDILSKLDMESLSESLTNLNNTLEPLMKLFGGKA